MSADSSLSCVAIAILAQCAVLVLDIFKAITSARFTTNSLGLSDNVISYIEACRREAQAERRANVHLRSQEAVTAY
jgi:hypothetical protein